ncbi:MAG: hypothetical protein ABI980_04150 [Nitrospirota bacterium]
MKQVAKAIRKSVVACVAISLVAGVTFLLCELGFRTLLFSQVAFMEWWRNPSLYTEHHSSDEDWWKLYHAFHKPMNPTTKHPHPLLGWTSEKFSEATYLHTEAALVGRRRPVLLYGDSFTQCLLPEDDCFQGLLNRDREFARTHYLLNYGVGGYGVDQMYLLLKNSLPLYHDPQVIVGIYTRDLDRSILSFFVGPKPHFEVVEDELVLQGTPIVQDPSMYQTDYPPRIWSYLYRLWLYQEGRPWRLRQYLRGTDTAQAKKQRINEQLVEEMLREIERRHLPVAFIIFADREQIREVGWREQFLADLLTRHGVPYISSRDVINKDRQRHGKPLEDYYLPNDKHPNAYQTRLIAQELKSRLIMSGTFGKQRSTSRASLCCKVCHSTDTQPLAAPVMTRAMCGTAKALLLPTPVVGNRLSIDIK